MNEVVAFWCRSDQGGQLRRDLRWHRVAAAFGCALCLCWFDRWLCFARRAFLAQPALFARGNGPQVAPAQHTHGFFLEQTGVTGFRRRVPGFEEQPSVLLLPCARGLHQVPTTGQPLAVELKRQPTLFIAALGVPFRFPSPAIPNHDRTTAVFM